MASKIKVDQIQTADGSGTIALQNQLSGMTGASMPTGSVLQVVHTSSSANATSTSTDWVDSGLSLAITPSSTSSKIKIEATCSVKVDGTGTTVRGGIRVLRGSTVIWNSDNNRELLQVRGSPEEINGVITPIILDTPSTTSATTYKVQMAMSTGSNMRVYQGASGTTMTLSEIAG